MGVEGTHTSGGTPSPSVDGLRHGTGHSEREREREGSSLSSLKAGRLVQMCNVVETYELTSMQASPANAGGSA